MIDAEYIGLIVNGWSKLQWPYTWTAKGKGKLKHTHAGDPVLNCSWIRQDLDGVLCQIFPHRMAGDVV